MAATAHLAAPAAAAAAPAVAAATAAAAETPAVPVAAAAVVDARAVSAAAAAANLAAPAAAAAAPAVAAATAAAADTPAVLAAAAAVVDASEVSAAAAAAVHAPAVAAASSAALCSSEATVAAASILSALAASAAAAGSVDNPEAAVATPAAVDAPAVATAVEPPVAAAAADAYVAGLAAAATAAAAGEARVGVMAAGVAVPVVAGAHADATAASQDFGSESEEVLCEGRVGLACVDVGNTPATVIRGAVLGALQRPDGPGVVSISGFLDVRALRFTKEGVPGVPPSAATLIFNTQSVKEMTRAMPDGTPVDNARRQVVMNPRLASTAVVRSSLARLCDRRFHVYGRRYEASEPKVLLNLPEAKPQMPHGDAADKDQLGNPPRMIGVVMAVEDGSLLDTGPGTFCDLHKPGDQRCVVRTSLAERTLVPVGGFLLFRGDMVHREVENTAGRAVLRRIHAYLTLCDSPMASEHWRDETSPVIEVP